MKKMLEYLRNDEELGKYRKDWEKKFGQPFPPWNYDSYRGVDDYKQRIKEALETGDYRKGNGGRALGKVLDKGEN